MSAQSAFRSGLYTALGTLFTEANGYVVTYGRPEPRWASRMVWLGDGSAESETGPMGTNRARNETLTCDVVLYAAGGGTDQQTPTESALTMLTALEDYLQDAGTAPSTRVTLGGAVRWATVTSHTLTQPEDPDELAQGRYCQITATVTAFARI